MAKSAKKKQTTKQVKAEKKPFVFSTATQTSLFLGLIVIVLVVLLKPLVIDGLSAQGVDVVGNLGKSHQITVYNKTANDRALWNPSLFSGMPVYHRISARAFSVDNVLQNFGRWFSVVFMYFLFGAIGFFILLRYLKMPPLLSLVGALLFILFPNYKSLYLEGHMSKLMALMYLPWIFVSFRYFIDRRNWLSMALFALAFGLQIRTQHYQIVFYSALMILALGVYPFIKDLLEKRFARFGKSTAMLFIGLALALTMAAQPLFLAKEYLPYSKRGKTTVDVSQKEQAQAATANKSNGVSLDYATQWSTAPSEMLTWVLPRFYGGMSSEKYQGSVYPQWKGRNIPGYWGHMPFTQSYEYMGLLMLILAIWGMVVFHKNPMLKSMIIFMLALILLSWGRHFEMFYSLFFNYVPFFNKFRAPMMSVTVNYFIMVIFAVYGLKYLSDLLKNDKSWKEQKLVLYSLVGFFALGIILFFVGQNASFIKAGGEPYPAQYMEIFKNIRAEYFKNDVLRYFILLLIFSGVMIGFLKKKISFTATVVILGALTVTDLIQVQGRSQKDFKNVKQIEAQYFRPSSTDKFLSNDTEVSRIFPVHPLFKDNRWAYYHQTIGGYSPIKMFTIEELVEKNIYNGWDPNLPINWNVLKILNVKYVIAQSQIQSPLLEAVHSDQNAKLFTYLFKDRLPRAFFVGEVKLVPDELKRLDYINQHSFDPAKTAVVEQEIEEPIATPDSAFAKLTSFSPNRLAFKVFTDKQALLVLSEVYYPPGWKIFIDGQRIQKIYKTDHAIQSVVVPSGAHNLEMRFEPDSYFKDIRIASVSVGILYLIILLSLLQAWLQKRQKQSAA